VTISRRKPPKNHKLVLVGLDVYKYDNMPLDDAIKDVLELSSDLIDPVFEFVWSDPYISGFQPMNELEKAQAEARRAASRKAVAAKKAKQEAEEKALLEKLKAKYD
jgi:hypothetical protein